MSEARETILRQIREAIGVPSDSPRDGWERIPRAYIQGGSLDPAERLALFLERLEDYDAATHVCRPEEVGAAVRRILQSHSFTRMLCPVDLPLAWRAEGIEWTPDANLSYAEIDNCHGVVSACSVAIALTGTIILQEGAPAQGRRVLSLVPDYHLCVVGFDQIRETVPEGFRAIETSSTLPITTISGPSATADIEMIRIRGVHGPRILEVLVVQ